MALVPGDYPARLAAAGVPVTTYGDWYDLGGSANHRAVVIHHTASSPSASPDADAAYCHHGSADAPLYNVLIDRYGKAHVLAREKSNNAGQISFTARDEAYRGQAGSTSAAARGLRDDGSDNAGLFAVSAQNSGTGEPWSSALVESVTVATAIACQCLGLHAGHVTQHRVLTAREVDPCGPGCPNDWAPLVAEYMQGGGGPEPEPWKGDEMFAVQDTEGSIYLAGPGVWRHLSGEEWEAWSRFLPPLAAAVNGRQRDLMRAACYGPAVTFARDGRSGAIYFVWGTAWKRHLASEAAVFNLQAHWRDRGADTAIYDWSDDDLDAIPVGPIEPDDARS